MGGSAPTSFCAAARVPTHGQPHGLAIVTGLTAVAFMPRMAEDTRIRPFLSTLHPSHRFFGPITDTAVRQWQAIHGLPATGYWGPMSRQVLHSAVHNHWVWPEQRPAGFPQRADERNRLGCFGPYQAVHL